jgi:leucyl/phenylalanyl-tRNA---protein transferase
MVAFLSEALVFPDPDEATEEGLIAVGGDLSVSRLCLAYRCGIFPWPVFEAGPLTWFSPDPRAILELDALHVSRSLKKTFRQDVFQVTLNQDFEAVISECQASTEGRESTWITEPIRQAYIELHHAGWAHSIETWQDSKLVGGLYGVAIGGFFAGESMFSRVSDASKVALVALVDHLKQEGFQLLDVQQATAHLGRMGASTLPRREFLRRLNEAVRVPARMNPMKFGHCRTPLPIFGHRA